MTVNTQPAILTTSIAVLEALKSKADIVPDYVAGHSLGEYSALVAAGSVSFSDAVQTVRDRGKFMDEAVPAGEGAMAAVLGMEKELLTEICQSVSDQGYPVQLANLNCPGQIVISGSAEGVQKASEELKEKGARRVIPLNVSGPFHSALMKPAADKLENKLNKIRIIDANIPVVSNVTGTAIHQKKDIYQYLIEQVYSPVLWEDSVQFMLENGVETFVEIGPGNVLSGLVKKINRRVNTFAVGDLQSLDEFLRDYYQ